MSADGERIRIRGIVQGVGFRPTLWRIAHELKLAGSVRNDGQGVLIEVWAETSSIDQLLLQLQAQLPPLAKIDSVQRQAIIGKAKATRFEIVASEAGAVATAVVADAVTCRACLAEVKDPANRRYRYAFTNCTHCGPRFSIVKAIPYDRANTSMTAFKMCPACQAEYDDPADRRFHAQPNACPECGPSLWLLDNQGDRIACDDVIEQTARLIKAGQIVAIKGIGGFHLACDAANETAVHRLRQRKRRYHKPFALLAQDVEMIRRYAFIDEQEQTLLQSSAGPIVLLQAQGESLAMGVAPGHRQLGFALPATPLHHLLLQALANPVVFTSGNVSDEPQCIANEEALDRLGIIADAFLLHDREIVNRVDDSVVRSISGQATMLRRGRGYTPAAITLPLGFENGPAVLAMGAELKNTFCLTQSGQAVVSQHIGDLESAPVLADYRRQLQLYQSLYQHRPKIVVVDRHPNYLSTQLGRQLAEEQGITCVEVQHHHAHIAAVMAEHGLPMDTPPVLGIALDGLGMGVEGELWGGEFLLADYRGFQRLAAFEPVSLLGGSQAMREPWRNTVAQLLHWFDWQQLLGKFGDLELIQYLEEKPITTLQQMAQRNLNSPLCSSAGRLFDAVAAALAICRDEVGYEGQAAIELEAMASGLDLSGVAYPVECHQVDGLTYLAWASLWRSLLDDLQQGVDRGEIAVRFHRGLIRAIADQAISLSRAHGVQTVVLAGGVFQNSLLLQGVRDLLTQGGINVLIPSGFPAGDGAISLGQAVVAMAGKD